MENIQLNFRNSNLNESTYKYNDDIPDDVVYTYVETPQETTYKYNNMDLNNQMAGLLHLHILYYKHKQY